MEARDVPTGIAPIIRDVESVNQYGALRFERKVFNRITDQGTTPIIMTIAKCNQCSTDTARMIYSTSWGAYQIMGFNIYDRSIGFTGRVSDFLFEHDVQDNAFFKFIVAKNIEYSAADLLDEKKRTAFAVTYNGSSAYADRVLSAMKRLGLA